MPNWRCNRIVVPNIAIFIRYKTTLPLVLSVYPEMGQRLLEGVVSLARRFGEFPVGYTMDNDVHRFDGQANGLAHHTLADGFYRNFSIDWAEALTHMAATFDGAEAQEFAKTGTTEPAHMTHTLDLAGAAYATAQVALSLGNDTLAKRLLALSDYSLNAYDKATCLLRNHTGTVYCKGCAVPLEPASL